MLLRTFAVLLLGVGLSLGGAAVGFGDEPARPFGLAIGKATYQEARAMLEARKWEFREYEKKQFREIAPGEERQGRNTFLKASPEKMTGVRGLLLFFSPEAVLDALIVVLDPSLFEVTMEDLDDKYELVKRDLTGEYFSTSAPHVLWQKGGTLIELQKNSPNRVRVVYVVRGLYENYKDFLNTTYESFRRQQSKPPWMKEL
ncbi:MAG: hypothetical protein PVI39_02445 [Desulfobacteraceae bacterium]|jgi:hypothetical protein